MSTPPADSGSAAPADQSPVEAALGLLDPDEWTISSVQGVITVVRRWSDESVDTIVILSPGTAYGRRDGHNRLMWSIQGGVGDVVPAMRDLPAPGRPGAPIKPIDERLEPDL